jgi:NADPH:quinone reductase
MRAGGKLAYPNGVEPKPRKRNGIEIIAYDAVPDVAEFKRLAGIVVKATVGRTCTWQDRPQGPLNAD